MLNFITEFLSNKERDSIYHVLFEEFQEAIIITHDDIIINANKKACILYECDLYLLVGKHINSLSAGLDKPLNVYVNKECDVADVEFHKSMSGAITPVSISSKSVLFDNKECQLLIIRNISTCINTHKYIDKILKYKDALVVCSKILLKNGDLLKTLDNTLETIIKLSDFSRVYLFENYVEDNDAYARLIVSHCAPGIESKRDDPYLYKFRYNDSPAMRTFLHSPSVMQYTVSSLRSSPRDMAILERFDIKSALMIPVIVNESLYGFLGFDNCINEIVYDDVTVDLLQLGAKQIGFYIAKKQYETSLHKSKEKLEDLVEERTKELVQKNTELEGFVYSLSHDIMSPLASIDMYAHSMLDEDVCGLDEKFKSFFFKTHLEVHHITDIVKSLLKLFKIDKEELNIKDNNLSNLLKQTYADTYKRKSDLIIEFNVDDNIIANCDAKLIKLVFENLMSNSVKYRDERKCLVISFSSWENEDKIIYKYSDNGIGFDMNKADDLFKPFYRVHPKNYPGSGIGLSIVKKIINVHGGDIWFESKQGVGTTFYFTLE